MIELFGNTEIMMDVIYADYCQSLGAEYSADEEITDSVEISDEAYALYEEEY